MGYNSWNDLECKPSETKLQAQLNEHQTRICISPLAGYS